MSEPILVVDTSKIRKGKLDDVKAAFTGLAAFVETHEATPLAYNVYFDGGARVTVVQLHPNTTSLERHLDIAGPRFAPFADLLTLQRVDIYGMPGEAALQRLRQKAEMLGNAPVVVNDFHAGFTRLALDREHTVG